MFQDDRMLDLAKLLDVSAFKAKVHQTNIANQNTPGYKAQAVRFHDAFTEALDRKGSDAARAVQPEVYEPRSTPVDNDGNDVALTREITEASQNALLYNTYISMMRGKHRLLNTAITGQGRS